MTCQNCGTILERDEGSFRHRTGFSMNDEGALCALEIYKSAICCDRCGFITCDEVAWEGEAELELDYDLEEVDVYDRISGESS